jgi:hypothetical protein
MSRTVNSLQISVIATFLIFGSIMLTVCYIAYSRPSGITGIDVKKAQETRIQKDISELSE